MTDLHTFLLVLLKESILRPRRSMEAVFYQVSEDKARLPEDRCPPLSVSPEDRKMRWLEHRSESRIFPKHLLPPVWKLNEMPPPSRTGKSSRASCEQRK